MSADPYNRFDEWRECFLIALQGTSGRPSGATRVVEEADLIAKHALELIEARRPTDRCPPIASKQDVAQDADELTGAVTWP